VTSRDEARRDAITRLRDSDIPSAVLDADLLLAHVIGGRKEDVYAHPELPLSEWAARTYRDVVERRARGEPVAYLRGVKEFYGLQFVVDPRVLIPRPETELIVHEVVRWGATRPGATICDVGTGSGAIAVCVAMELPRSRVVAIDASEEALALARENALRHDVLDRITFLQGDLLEPLSEAVDAVVANLPYVPSSRLDEPGRSSLAYEPRAALDGGPDGLKVIRRAIAMLPARLAGGGAAFFECDPAQAEHVEAALRNFIRGRTRRIQERVVIAERD
jgi:release factor glutamine methyltransferase